MILMAFGFCIGDAPRPQTETLPVHTHNGVSHILELTKLY